MVMPSTNTEISFGHQSGTYNYADINITSYIDRSIILLYPDIWGHDYFAIILL